LGFDAAEFGGAQSEDRRFFHAPDIVRSFDNVGSFDGILIQSGNRARPNGLEVENFLFYLKDRQTESGSEATRAQNDSNSPLARYHFSDIRDQTDCIEGSEQVLEGAKTIPCAERILENGWKIRYERAGEKGLSAPFTDGGRVFSSTFTPGGDSTCPVQPGTGRLYITQLKSATAVAPKQRYFDLGTGIPAAAIPVGDVIYLPGGGIDLYDLDGDGLADNSKLLPSHAGRVYRTYWREPGNDPL
jgi:type IV pilus assembly protein PilY1